MIRCSPCSPVEDGLDAIRVVVAEAARLLRPAGLLCIEHADVQGESAQQILVEHGGFAAYVIIPT